MKNLKILSIIVTVLMLFINNVKAQIPSSDPAYHLIWADSFPNTIPNSVKIDTSKWYQKWGWNQSDTFIHNCDTSQHIDAAYYKWYEPTNGDDPNYIDTTNAQVSGGHLDLFTRKETYSGECWTFPNCHFNTGSLICNKSQCGPPPSGNGDSICWHAQNKQFKYTSSLIISKINFRYGYFEMKFMLPSAPPSNKRYYCGPSFWMYAGGTCDDPNTPVPYSEIDIMELDGYNNDYTSNVHYAHYPHNPCANNTLGQFHNYGIITSNAWHTTGCLWTSHEITYYFDGQPIYTMTNNNVRPDSLLAMPIIIYALSPDNNFCRAFDPDSTANYDYKIGYVKVWQIKPACGTAINFCNSSINPATYVSQDSLFQSVTIGGTGCTTQSITNTNFISFYGSNFVQLGDGFSIDNNSSSLMDVRDCIPFSSSKAINMFQLQPMPEVFKCKLRENLKQQ